MSNLVRRGLLLAGLAVTGWAVTRLVLLLSGHDVVTDPHGYVAIFSLVLVPLLALAIGTLVAALRHGRRTLVPGVALVLSAPLASPLALVAVAIGLGIVAVALVDRARSGGGH